MLNLIINNAGLIINNAGLYFCVSVLLLYFFFLLHYFSPIFYSSFILTDVTAFEEEDLIPHKMEDPKVYPLNC